ncbi:MAG: ATP-binding protein [Panacagrimonas sp.]
MSWSASFRMRSDLADVSDVTAWLDSLAQQHGMPEAIAQRIDLCLVEVLTNVVTHGLAEAQTGEIQLEVLGQGADVAIEIADRGLAFNPTEAVLPPPVTMADDRIGGWGLCIVRKMSDEIRYRRVDGHNRLTLVFHPRPSAA